MNEFPQSDGKRRRLFVDIGFEQCNCHGEKICGDCIKMKRIAGGDRFVAVLADGLGHGVKANIMASMTAVMALRFIEEDRDVLHSAEVIMDTLPVCRERGISYAAFSIADIRPDGESRIIEMGNPPVLLLRDGKPVKLNYQAVAAPRHAGNVMRLYTFHPRPGDRVICCSDGVTQAGMGTDAYPMGWGNRNFAEYLEELVSRRPDIASRELAEFTVREAVAKEPEHRALDDISCCCAYFRYPRRMLLFTGPPFHRDRDAECAKLLKEFEGVKVICGGTTAAIIGREWGVKSETDLATVGGDLPPVARMPGVDLVTEGIFTLTRTMRYLERNELALHDDAASRLGKLLLSCDRIEFLVGTRINEAHQDPNLPVELELRRTIVRRLSELLRNRYLREVDVRFI